METVDERVDSIEEIMKQLSLAQLITEKELTGLSKSLEESHQRNQCDLQSSVILSKCKLTGLKQFDAKVGDYSKITKL